MSNYDFELDLETQNTMSVINNWIEPGHAVLEFGPANGRLTRYLSQNKNCSMTIVELDPASGAEAAAYAKNSYVGEELGDIEKYHWLATDQKYDSIIFADVLEHLRNPEAVLKNCSQVLKDTGSILISVPNLGHNSVIISLLNDQFMYSETGLLDRTHIHFFTYESLIKTIKDSGYYINEIVPIYSRVGENEIPATYAQVPVSLERYLRKRKTGYVYQFVCKISKTDCGNAWETSVSPFMQEYSRQVEAQCYYTDAAHTEFSQETGVSMCFSADEEIHMQVKLPPHIQKIRLDPLEETAIVQLKKAEIITQNGEHHPLEVAKATSEYDVNNLYFFMACDPQFIFNDIPAFDEEVQFHAVYQILNFSESDKFYQKAINALRCALETEGQQNYSCDAEKLQKQILQLKKNMEEADEEYKKKAQNYESAIKDLKDWNTHLENDLAEINKARAEERELYDTTMGRYRSLPAYLKWICRELTRRLRGKSE